MEEDGISLDEGKPATACEMATACELDEEWEGG